MFKWSLTVFGLALAVLGTAALAQTSGAGAAILAGEWRSTTNVGGRPEVTLAITANGAAAGSMTLRGEWHNQTEWATMTLDEARWRTDRLTFTTRMPHDEGTVYWTLSPSGPRSARLTAVPDDYDPSDDVIRWEMTKQ